MVQVNRLSRRAMLRATVAAIAIAGLPAHTHAAEAVETVLDDPAALSYAYVDRRSGRVVAVKGFMDVHPELKAKDRTLSPYLAPVQNVYLGASPVLVQEDAARYGIADLAARKALSAFDSLHHSYSPGEYTHHVLLNLGDRELAREDVGNWALAHATEDQKARALAVLHRQHGGYNGRLITGDAEKMAKAVRFYTGREVLRPMLFMGIAPAVGDLAMIGSDGLRLASLGPVQLALAGADAVSGAVGVGTESTMAHAVSVAAEGATAGVSAAGASVGNAAAAGAGSGASSSAGDGGSGSGGSGSGSGSSGSSGSGGGSGGGAGAGGGVGGGGGF